MLKQLTLLAALFAALAVAGPAAAQQPATDTPTQAPVCSGTGESDPGTCTSGDSADGAPQQTVGDPQVITDPAAQVDGTATTPSDGDGPLRGEQHVLDARRSSSATPGTPKAAPRAARHTATVSAASPAPAPAATAATAKTLPFTGVNAGYLALAGALLLGAGLAIRRTAALY
ncbi:MAG: hypothetical protein QOF37_1525 [Thermoleophilaceae bacterium]|jgi:hypothetical protein|nr:hypothetical protein [Thermoleophilaceae bacterium]